MCASLTSHLPYRALKRTKAYATLEDTQPTLKNKPSGLKADWRKTVKAPTPRQQIQGTYTRFSSSSTLSSSSSTIPQSPPPDLDIDHTSSMLAVSPPPIFSKPSSPPSFHGNIVPLVDAKATDRGQPITVKIFISVIVRTANPLPQPFSLPRAFKEKDGQKQQPGIRHLPLWLRENFRNLYIRRIVEQVCSSRTPWSNPGLASLQREFNYTYPTHRVRLHSDDAAVVPVSFDHCTTTRTDIL